MKVSVIIPTYNRANILKQTVDSVLNQTFQDFEIIVIDDGSIDDTQQIFSDYSDKVRYKKQQNAGVNAARNHALQLAKGEYIATLDDDDMWLDYKLELQVEILDKFTDIGFTYSNFFILQSDGRRTANGLGSWHESSLDWSQIFEKSFKYNELSLQTSFPHIPDDTILLHIGDIYHASLYQPHVLPSTAIFRRALLPDEIRFIEHDSICGDWDFFARLSKCHKVVYLDLETTLNRSHEDTFRLTRTDHRIQLDKRIEFIKRVWKSDAAFYRKNKTNVDQTLNRALVELSYLHVMSGNIDAATSAFDEITPPYEELSKKQFLIAGMGIRVPGSARLFRLLRQVKHQLHS
jgi:glycosyltransferase involved in cell wall biosynthesis